jgi:hypothetical protein
VWTPGTEGEGDTVTWASFFLYVTASTTLPAFEVFRAKARADWYVAGRGLRLGGRGRRRTEPGGDGGLRAYRPIRPKMVDKVSWVSTRCPPSKSITCTS